MAADISLSRTLLHGGSALIPHLDPTKGGVVCGAGGLAEQKPPRPKLWVARLCKSSCGSVRAADLRSRMCAEWISDGISSDGWVLVDPSIGPKYIFPESDRMAEVQKCNFACSSTAVGSECRNAARRSASQHLMHHLMHPPACQAAQFERKPGGIGWARVGVVCRMAAETCKQGSACVPEAPPAVEQPLPWTPQPPPCHGIPLVSHRRDSRTETIAPSSYPSPPSPFPLWHHPPFCLNNIDRRHNQLASTPKPCAISKQRHAVSPALAPPLHRPHPASITHRPR